MDDIRLLVITLGEPRETQQAHFDKFKGARRGHHPERLVSNCDAE